MTLSCPVADVHREGSTRLLGLTFTVSGMSFLAYSTNRKAFYWWKFRDFVTLVGNRYVFRCQRWPSYEYFSLFLLQNEVSDHIHVWVSAYVQPGYLRGKEESGFSVGRTWLLMSNTVTCLGVRSGYFVKIACFSIKYQIACFVPKRISNKDAVMLKWIEESEQYKVTYEEYFK